MLGEDTVLSLHQAAIYGNLQHCELLLQRGLSVNTTDSEGRTALFYAVQHEQRRIIEFLLNKGADVNLRDNKTGQTPLHSLAAMGKEALITLLFRKTGHIVDMNVMEFGVEGLTPIHIACQNGHDGVVRLLLTLAQTVHVDSLSRMGKTPLIYAAQHNHLPVIRVLAEHSADVNIKSVNEEGLTALHYAVKNNSITIVSALLNMGADANILCNRLKQSPVHRATVFGNLEILKLLSEYGGNLNQPVGNKTGNLPIHLAAYYGQAHIVRWFYEINRDFVYMWNRHGQGIIHLAAAGNSINTIAFIIDEVRLPVNSRTKNRSRKTALHIASRRSNYSAVCCLIDRQASVNAVAREKRYTPLHYATMKGNSMCVDLLYRAGGNVHVHYGNEDRAGRGEPLLITAAKYNSYDVAAFLLSENLNVSLGYRDNDGLTALHHAAISSGDKLTRLLLAKGAHVDDVNNSNRTALHYAVERGDTEVLQEILRNSPSLAVQDKYGMNPVHLAAYVGKLACLQLLIKDGRQFDIQTGNALLDLPIHLAALGGHTDVVKWMIECGVPIDVRNAVGKTALDIAIERGNEEMINVLQSRSVRSDT